MQDLIDHAFQAIELGDDQYIIYDSRAAVYEKLGMVKNALRDAKKVIDLAPDRWNGYVRSARLFLASRKHEIALTMVDLAFERIKADDHKRHAEVKRLKEEVGEAQIRAEEVKRATAYHFGKLPVEIVSDVFILVVSENPARVITLSRICKHWRGVALNTTSLWGTLILTHRNPTKKAKQWIERSKGRIRDLTIRSSAAHGINWSVDSLEAVLWAQIRSCKVEDWKVLKRLKTLSTIDFLSNLEALEVTGCDVGIDELFYQLDAPKLHTLTFVGGIFPWYSISTRVSNLIFLDVRGASLRNGEGIPAVLKSNLNLRTLILDLISVNTTPVDNQLEPLELPCLTQLEVGGYMLMDNLLKTIAMPSLRILRLFGSSTPLDSALDAIMRRGSLPLTTLRVQSCYVKAAKLIQFLHLTPSLETLQLTKLSIPVNQIVDALAKPSYTLENNPDLSITQSTVLCPKLRDVDFSHCLDIRTGSLLRLVKSRLPSSRVDGNVDVDVDGSVDPARISSLIVDGCLQVEAEILPWLRSQVEKVSCVYMSKKDAKWKR